MKRRGFLKALLGTAGAALVMGPAALVKATTPTLPATQPVAYTIPGVKRLPEALVIYGDTVKLPDIAIHTTTPVSDAVDFLLEHANDARWDVMARAMETINKGMVRKTDKDAWNVLLSKGSYHVGVDMAQHAYGVGATNPCGEIPLLQKINSA